jgi:hypothetical protein
MKRPWCFCRRVSSLKMGPAVKGISLELCRLDRRNLQKSSATGDGIYDERANECNARPWMQDLSGPETVVSCHFESGSISGTLMAAR